jgi:hypothetical protein
VRPPISAARFLESSTLLNLSLNDSGRTAPPRERPRVPHHEALRFVHQRLVLGFLRSGESPCAQLRRQFVQSRFCHLGQPANAGILGIRTYGWPARDIRQRS